MSDMIDAQSVVDIRNLAVALGIGFLVGFEREWTKAAEAHAHTFAGARTFALVALTGGLAGLIDAGAIFVSVSLLAVSGLTITAYWAVAKEKPGTGGTTEIAIIATFLLGVAATRGFLLTASIGGVTVAIVLSIKHSVEQWAGALSHKEIQAALRLLVISVIVLPILPAQGYGPYQALNPRELWLMVVLISGLSFLGYWSIKFMGAGRGVLLTGLAGGLASSTATTLSLAGLARKGAATPSVAAGIIAANVVMLLRVGLLLLAVSRGVLAVIWPTLLTGVIIGAVAAAFLWRNATQDSDHEHTLLLDNPLALKSALLFAGLLAVVVLASSFGIDVFGESGLLLVALLTGVVDVDALTLTAGRQAVVSNVSEYAAGAAVLAAVAANIIFKAGAAGSVGGKPVGLIVGGVFLAIIAGGAFVYMVF
ncbi:MAG: DUF4010 domain-containing protein [Pseudomonadota bacterium]